MFSILIIIFSFKFINYNKNHNISHTGISPSTTCALCLPNTLAVSPSITCALGLPSTQGGSPSAHGWANQAPSGCGLGRGHRECLAQRPSPAVQRQVSVAPISAPPAWRLDPAGCSLISCSYQTMQSIIKTLIIYRQCRTVQSTVNS